LLIQKQKVKHLLRVSTGAIIKQTDTMTQIHSSNGTTATPSSSNNKLSRRLRDKIVETVQLNRLTIIVGPTGSGKTTLVPPLILEEIKGRICCTQPRRLAVVAIAKRVAELQGVPVGGEEVGYHVGNHNRSMKSTKLVFSTAGILLEELRARGVAVLREYSCLILDECHERSPESDLVLCMIRQLMKAYPKEHIRIVLMSATFDHKRYSEYFRNIPGCTTIDTITLETAQSFDAFYTQVKTYYLEDMKRILPDIEKHHDWLQLMEEDPDFDLGGDESGNRKSLSQGLLALVQSLVTYLDESKPPNQPFLIFAPTYNHLEQIHDTLLISKSGALRQLSVLHSAVDIEDCLKDMYTSVAGTSNNGDSRIIPVEMQRLFARRRIFLASAIADSSITIPGVSVVIDLCRALEVSWSVCNRQSESRTVWASQSICQQRQGRTGRTCPGEVFRLLTYNFYQRSLPPWDIPLLTLSSCHNESLQIACSSNQLNPRDFFPQCLDPPEDEVVVAALEYLQEIGAYNGRSTTQYGSLLAAMPMNVMEARIVMEGARLGLLHETVALMALYSSKPSPIAHFFGNSDINEESLRMFHHEADVKSYTSVALAHLSAYMYWDVHWNQVKIRESLENPHGSVHHIYGEEEHILWCKEHNLNPTSVRSISESIDCSMNTLFLSKYEPLSLQCSDPTPLWRRPQDWKSSRMSNSRQMLLHVYGDMGAMHLCNTLTTLCEKRMAVYALPNAQVFWDIPSSPRKLARRKHNENVSYACIHFLSGHCKFGDRCRHEHSWLAIRPPCRFFREGNCSRGSECVYSHAIDEEIEDISDPLEPLIPVLEELQLPNGPRAWFQRNSPRLFLLGEGNFGFTKALYKMGAPPMYASTLQAADADDVYLHNWVHNVDATNLLSHSDVQSFIYRGGHCFAWNYPHTARLDDPTADEELMLRTMKCLYSLLTKYQASVSYSCLNFAVTLQGDQFSRWNLLRCAYRTGFRLKGWCPFEPTDFPDYRPSRTDGTIFKPENSRFYLLECRL
jgi:energy-coupling factor transporter ATP-binding protein EcfA2